MIGNCPVQKYAKLAIDSAAEFTQNMRSLRRSLLHCQTCASEDDCPIRARFSETLRAALLDVQEELGLHGS